MLHFIVKKLCNGTFIRKGTQIFGRVVFYCKERVQQYFSENKEHQIDNDVVMLYITVIF